MKRLFVLATVTVALAACSTDKESMSVYLAKEMCSCRFLVGLSQSNCRKSMSLALVMGDVAVDEAKGETSAASKDGSHAVSFKYVSKYQGCELRR